MRSLTIHWLALLSIGLSFIAVDVAYRPLIDVNGVPAVGVIGAALIVLVVTSRLNWVFKEAWTARQNTER
jgi:hypothetical protein